jgi:hypothetical protein
MPQTTPEAKVLMAVLTPQSTWDSVLCAAIEKAFGSIEYRGPLIPFQDDAYYAAELGSPLWRGWLSFRGLAAPETLASLKRTARDLEDQLRIEERRTCNLDVGYMDADKLVLGSFKRGPFKLYLGGDVWADMILGYSRGVFTPTPWAFPDFRDGRYDKCLGIIRDKLKAEMRR